MRTTILARSALAPLALAPVLALTACRPNTTARADASHGEPVTLTSARAPESPSLKTLMRDHDLRGAAMRDAVARGDLDRARREARLLADYRIAGDLAPPWRGLLDAMGVAAARAAEARDLGEASRGLAAVARSCGDCHATLGGPGPVVGEPPGEGSGVGLRMKRHQWAVARLWDGLAAPSDDAWRAGARVLTDAPLEPEVLTPGRSPAPAIGSLAQGVHEIAKRAAFAEAAVDRGAVYGDLMATCAGCHARLGGGPP